MIERNILRLDEIATGNDNTDKIKEIDEYFLFVSDPGVFSGRHSKEISFELQFDELCTLVADQTGLDINNSTTLSFLNSLNYIKSKSAPTKNGEQPNKIRRSHNR